MNETQSKRNKKIYQRVVIGKERQIDIARELNLTKQRVSKIVQRQIELHNGNGNGHKSLIKRLLGD